MWSSKQGYNKSRVASNTTTTLPLTTRTRSMEDVWRNITDMPTTPAISLQTHRRPEPATLGGIILQDFLAGAAAVGPPPPSHDRIPLNPHLAAALNLNSAPDLHPDSDSNGADGGGGGNRRHKRMIKNRESAARSRARKQAYTSELELEVAHLVKENGKLKRQNEKLRIAIEAQASTKRTLQRTSTAPF